ncbi:hypothetical protein [Streptomyces caatingaensis]|uniref:Uncharacterized protein n=1 Tax=Streptomyces caatingaensis TaxID=1678637 RepID=A0A0K9X9F8_9ACTN|nr:hypothetical protein [Streptomyces caatingaensis]KNB50070.1 hypothetical protein AC230_25515 [Streptomyces caatingaensis]
MRTAIVSAALAAAVSVFGIPAAAQAQPADVDLGTCIENGGYPDVTENGSWVCVDGTSNGQPISDLDPVPVH